MTGNKFIVDDRVGFNGYLIALSTITIVRITLFKWSSINYFEYGQIITSLKTGRTSRNWTLTNDLELDHVEKVFPHIIIPNS